MVALPQALITRELEEGTGASISIKADPSGLRKGLQIWFSDLKQQCGPVAELHPYGLKRHKVELSFGNFSGPVIRQIMCAGDEDLQLARALIESISADVTVEIPGQTKQDWTVSDGKFRIIAKRQHAGPSDNEPEMIATCRGVIVPMMAAMAELIGHDVVEAPLSDNSQGMEGAVFQSFVKKRERNPRNRLLCIRIHGDRCKVCGLDPCKSYASAGSILEVHHLEPLALLAEARSYNPKTDLVPLCPNCHRAVHTRRPVPLTPEELQHLLEGNHG